jgi:small neutral amino acid transporter SnatA (MarC family)
MQGLAFTQAQGDAAQRARSRRGLTGLNIATPILGLLLAAMAVQTMAEGLKGLFPAPAR